MAWLLQLADNAGNSALRASWKKVPNCQFRPLCFCDILSAVLAREPQNKPTFYVRIRLCVSEPWSVHCAFSSMQSVQTTWDDVAELIRRCSPAPLSINTEHNIVGRVTMTPESNKSSISTCTYCRPRHWMSRRRDCPCTVGDRAFSVAAARTWNSLPAEVTSSNSLQTFKTRLNSH